MATSGTYLFSSLQSEQIITDAYQRIGISPTLLVPEQVTSAQRSINFILSTWPNKNINLWLIKQEIIALNPGQATYQLPTNTVGLRNVTLRQSVRELGGIPASSSGIAANAFDGNPATACTQTAPNGWISYDWGANAQYAIQMVGVQSNVNNLYTLSLQYSNNGVDWVTALNPLPQDFPAGELIWFVIPVPTNGRFFRIMETGGATLDIQELYFNNMLQDNVLTPISRFEWMSQPNKNQQARPSSFYYDAQVSPTLTLWPVPTAQYTTLFYTRELTPEDIGTLRDTPNVPSRFLEALTAALSFYLGIKNQIDIPRIQILKSIADEEFKFAWKNDDEKVDIRIYGDYMQGWSFS